MGFNSFEFADEVCTSLLGNLNTLAVGNSTLNIWTDCTAALNKAWQTGGPNSIWLREQIDGLDQHFKPNGDPDIAADQKAMKDFIAKCMNGSGWLNNFTTADIAELLTKLSGNCWDANAGPAQMSTIQSFGNVVSATQQIQTSTGDTASKAQGSFLQQSTSAQQSISDLGNSAIGVLGTLGSILMQSFL